MVSIVSAALSYPQVILGVVGSMVLMVLATALLETHTPAPRRRATRLSMPRRVEERPEESEDIEPAELRARYDRELARRLTPGPMVLLRPGPAGPEPVAAVSIDEVAAAAAVVDAGEDQVDVHGPPTQEVPVVVLPAVARTESFDPRARTAIRSAVAHRMAPAEQFEPGASELSVPVPAVTGAEVFFEDTLATSLESLDAMPGDSAVSGEPRGDEAEPVPSAQPAAISAVEADGPSKVFAARVELPGGSLVELGEPGMDRTLAGVLFAAYVVSGGAERKRVTGWVAAAEAPPSLSDLTPEVRLRGRPGKVAALLSCGDGGRNWVTLDDRTAIRRGLTSRPPTDEVLKGLVWWWFMATDDQAAIPAEHVAVLRGALEAVLGALEDHPLGGLVGDLAAAAAEAEEARVGMRVESVRAGTGGSPTRRDGAGKDVPDTGDDVAEVAVAS